MEIILREDVEKLGTRGQVLKVTAGYARNFLLPRRLEEFAGKEVVDGRNSRRSGLAECRALHGSQSRKGQEIGPGIHSDVGVEQDIKLGRRDLLARFLQARRQSNDVISPSVDRPRDLILGAGHPEHGVPRLLSGKGLEQPRIMFANRMPIEKPRDQTDADGGAARRAALLRSSRSRCI